MQSKGRARAKPSRYILMVGHDERGKREAKYREFQRIEKIALKECHNLSEKADVSNFALMKISFMFFLGPTKHQRMLHGRSK